MKWIKKSMVSLILLAYVFTDARAATDEELAEMYLRLYTGSSMEEYVDAHVKKAESLMPHIDNDRHTAVYLHGWNEDINSTSVNAIISAYLARNDHNVIAVDWSVIADKNYLVAAGDDKSVGTTIASALNDMVNAGLSSEKVHVIGHSLGAQVAGEVSRNVNFTMPRLTGLDPAGPFFYFNVQRIVKSDARFVDIIHTDKGVYGTKRESGTVDFLPNGGRRIQPGCPHSFWPFTKEAFCSHHRSYFYYAESLTRERSFLAVPCSEDEQSSSTGKPDADPIVMGYGVPTNARGIYCLVTGSSEPYGLGVEGAHRT